MPLVMKAPSPLLLEGNLSENWTWFKRDLDNFLIAAEKDSKSDRIKLAILQTYIGDAGLELLDSFHLTSAEANDYQKVLQKFEDHCCPRKNLLQERYQFLNTRQKVGESIDNFLARLNLRILSCEYEKQDPDTLRDQIVRDQLVVGLADKDIQRKLLREKNITLKKAVELIKDSEESQHRKKEQTASSELEETDIQSKRWRNNFNGSKYFSDFNKQSRFNNWRTSDSNNNDTLEYNCKKCGHIHKPRECRAFGKFCSICNGSNHFAIGCFNKK